MALFFRHPAWSTSLSRMALIFRVALSVLATLLVVEVVAAAARADLSSSPNDERPPLRVFVLAGQSNMVGMGSLEHLALLVNESSSCCCNDTNEYRNELWNGTGYKTKDNVYIKFGDRQGKLTVGGYGGGRGKFGPEVGIGWVLGDAFDDGKEILLIKAAYGGRDLAIDFRPPSSGEGNFSNVHPIKYGWQYRIMISDILAALGNISSIVPHYEDAYDGYELSSFVWFQGWNDYIDTRKVDQYGQNLANLIRDVRLDLDAPHLPVVVGELGMHGLYPEGKGVPRVMAMRAQEHGITLLEPFRNNTLFVRTGTCGGSNSNNYLLCMEAFSPVL